MWKVLRNTAVLVIALLTAACDSEDAFVTGGATGITGSSAAEITLLASSPQMGSSGTSPVIVTAIVKDGNNALMQGVPVTFAATSGALETTQGTTNAAGQASASLTPGGNFANRSITVSANAGGLSESVTIDVTGTALAINGESSATLEDATVLTITLRDSGGNPIANRNVTVASALGNTLSASSLDTNSSGQVQVTFTATVSGADTITVSGQGASATHAITVSADQFAIESPTPGASIDINECTELELTWQQDGGPASGETIKFSSTRGTFYSDAACTTPADSTIVNAGTATIHFRSANAGPAVLTAFVDNGPSTTRTITFVATDPDSIAFQAEPTTIGPNDGSQGSEQRSTLSAVVRDADNNLVAGKLVRFTILEDNSGGTLSASTAITDAQGRASTSYISAASTTAKDGVRIRAWVDEDPAISAEVALTVAQRSLFVRLGTGNEIEEPNSTQYRMPYAVIVTDANGNAAAGANVSVSVTPLMYGKGEYEYDGTVWNITYDGICPSEDVNRNGVLDAGEDSNGNGQLTPGNVASVPTQIVTGADGTFQFGITYPQQYANWVLVELAASTSVQGTESIDSATFWLPISADDVEDDVAPPGVVSPFGTGVCP